MNRFNLARGFGLLLAAPLVALSSAGLLLGKPAAAAPSDVSSQFVRMCDLAAAELEKPITPFGDRKSTESATHHMPFFEDGHAVRALCVGYDRTGNPRYLRACRRWADRMVAFQSRMIPAGAYFMNHSRAPGQDRGEWNVADSGTIAMGVLATAVRSRDDDAGYQRYLNSAKAFAQLVIDNYIGPEGGITNGCWSGYSGQWWCSTATAGSLLLLLYEETGDPSYLRAGRRALEWMVRQDFRQVKPINFQQRPSGIVFYCFELYATGLRHLEPNSESYRLAKGQLAEAVRWMNEHPITQGPAGDWDQFDIHTDMAGLAYLKYSLARQLPEYRHLAASADRDLAAIGAWLLRNGDPPVSRLIPWEVMSWGMLSLAERLNPAALGRTSASAHLKVEKPTWLGSRAGLSDDVLPPWTPVVASGPRVAVWGRRYTFGPLTMPVEVVARDCPLLTAPITLSGVADGRAIAWQGPDGRLEQSGPSRARLRGSAACETLTCEGAVEIEYDGMVRCDLRLVPKRKPVRLGKLVLEIPLTARHAKYLHTWPGRWGTAGNSAALPAEGFRGPFKPFVWLGDEWRGLAWFAESDRNFFLAPKQPALEIVRGEGAVTLRVNLIGQAQTLDGALEYTFGFQATPVKPATPDAWDLRTCHMGAYGMEKQPYPAAGKGATLLDYLAKCGVRTLCFHEHWTDVQNYPGTTHGAELRSLVAACHQRKIQLLLYHGYEMSNIAPEWDAWHEQCLVYPRAGGYKRQPEQTDYIVCYRSPWQNFLADGLKKLIDQYDIDGVYLDGTSEPWGCANTRHGCGYKKADGTVGQTYSIFATRSMMKRIYTIVKSHRPEGQVNVHQSTCMTIPTLAFATSYWDGEQLQSVKRAAAAQEVLPMDAFRSEFMGHNWGVPAELLWYASGPFKRSEAVATALLHDVPVRPLSAPEVETSARIWQAFDQLGRSQSRWLPYWENAAFVKAAPADARVSLYNRPGKGLLAVVVNTGRQPCQAEVSLDLKALQQPAGLQARNVMTGRPIELRAGQITLPLEPLDYRLIRVEGK